MDDAPDPDAFAAGATAWLDEHAERRTEGDDEFVWGKGEFSVSVFHALSEADERGVLERIQAWTQLKAARGYHAISAPQELGGLGLPPAFARAFGRLERG